MTDLSRPRHAQRGDDDVNATAALPSMVVAAPGDNGVPPAASSAYPIAAVAVAAIAAAWLLSTYRSTGVLIGVAVGGAACLIAALAWARRRDASTRAGVSQLALEVQTLRYDMAGAKTALATAMREQGQHADRLVADNGALRQQLESMNATFEHARAWYLDQLTTALATIPADASTRAALAVSEVNTDDPVARAILQLKAYTDTRPWSVTPVDTRAVDIDRFLSALVDIGYRCQDVAHRAIDNIDTLIRQVSDPDVLAPLFEIDHLITRVRRLSENLILIGGPPPRQWRDACALPTVIRSAKAEIEQYRRVDVTQHLTAAVHGHVVVPLVHLLAELLENAVSFSKPDTRVSLSTRQVTAGVAISIQDEGLGMDAAALDRANEKLRTDTSVERLLRDGRLPGLWVVGHLARTYEIRVQLASNIFGGITASVVLPHVLLTGAPTDAATVPGTPPVPRVTEPMVAVPQTAASSDEPRPNRQWPQDETAAGDPPAPAEDPAGEPATRAADDELPPLPVRRPGKLSMATELRRAPDAPGGVAHDSPGAAAVMAGFLSTTQQVRGDVPLRSGTPQDDPCDAQGDATR